MGSEGASAGIVRALWLRVVGRDVMSGALANGVCGAEAGARGGGCIAWRGLLNVLLAT